LLLKLFATHQVDSACINFVSAALRSSIVPCATSFRLSAMTSKHVCEAGYR
jgi:hypothetical protein